MTYTGGKAGAGVYQAIINCLPPHRLYIEPFLGAGAILRYKRPAPASIALDQDPAAIAAFNPDPPIPHLTLYRADALQWLHEHGPTLPPDALIYADPPYLMSTRSTKQQYYQYDFYADAQHRELLHILTAIPCMVALSGYYSDLYASTLDPAGWSHTTFQAQTRSGRPATEWLWTNYPLPPARLHDYRYLGANYRQRETIRKQQRRWAQRLTRMTPLQRYALLSTLQTLDLED